MNARPPYDVLIFDLFGVVISFDEDRVYQRLATYCAQPARAFVSMQGLVSQAELVQGRKTLSQLHRELVREYGLTLDIQAFEMIWREPYSEPMPGMADLLRSLASRYTLVLLSNVDRYYWQSVQDRHPELEHFDARLLSFQLGTAKPDRQAFLNAIEAAHAPAQRCFFVDDKQENIVAAGHVGIAGHRFVTIDKLRGELLRLGIL